MVLALLREFFSGYLVLFLPENPTSPNSNSTRIEDLHESEFRLTTSLDIIVNHYVSFLFPGSAGGGVASGEMNRTIQQFLGSFARETFGTPRKFSILLQWLLFYCVEGIRGLICS